ncbi:MAG: YggT family protein [Pseudomonadota bacterium]
MAAFADILFMFLNFVKFFIFAHFVMSWLIAFNVLNLYQPVVGQVWGGLNRLLEPIYGPIRNILPNMGGIDLAPLVALFGILAIERILVQVFFGV